MKANENENKRNNERSKTKITADMLKSGEVLSALILRFLNNRNKENMLALLSCLRDSNIWMPARVSNAGRGLEVDTSHGSPIMAPAKHKLVVKPQIYKAKDGNMYLPIYSRRENIKKENVKDFSVVNIPYEQCLEMLDGIPNCSRIVVDPHLYNVALDEDLIKVTKRLPSRLSGRKE